MINLLTPEKKQALRKMYLFRVVVVSLATLVVIFITGATFLLPSFFLALLREEQLTERVDGIQRSSAFKETERLEKIISDTNTETSILSQGDGSLFSNVILVFLDEKGPDVVLSGFFFQKDRGQEVGAPKINIKGTARTRDALISFVERMKKNNIFSSIELPVSSFIKSQDVPFSITVYLNGDKP